MNTHNGTHMLSNKRPRSLATFVLALLILLASIDVLCAQDDVWSGGVPTLQRMILMKNASYAIDYSYSQDIGRALVKVDMMQEEGHTLIPRQA